MDYIVYISKILPVLIIATTIGMLAVRTIFDDRYIKQPKQLEDRYISEKDLEAYKNLILVYLENLESKIKEIKEEMKKWMN